MNMMAWGKGRGAFISIFFSLGKKSDYLMYSADLSITAIYYFHRGHMRHGNHRNHGFSMATACSSNNIYTDIYEEGVPRRRKSADAGKVGIYVYTPSIQYIYCIILR